MPESNTPQNITARPHPAELQSQIGRIGGFGEHAGPESKEDGAERARTGRQSWRVVQGVTAHGLEAAVNGAGQAHGGAEGGTAGARGVFEAERRGEHPVAADRQPECVNAANLQVEAAQVLQRALRA